MLPLWLRSAITTLTFPGVVAGLVPILLGTGGWRLPLPLGPAHWLGFLFLLPGVAGLWLTIGDFAREGQGTLAPWDAPTRLVRRRLYAWVRNPMYVAVLAAILGQAILWASGGILIYLALIAAAFHLRVVITEEPVLRKKFGAGFDTYMSQVPRWVPRPPGHPPLPQGDSP